MKQTIVMFALISALWAVSEIAHAEPLFFANQGTTSIILFSEPCVLPEVANLPRRAQWIDGAEIFEGCWSITPLAPLVIAYFADKTVATIPTQLFKKAQGV